VPLQLILRLAQLRPKGPWGEVAASFPKLVSYSAPHGFVSDWTDLRSDPSLYAVPTIGSYDAIRVYLWAGMLNSATNEREAVLKSLSGMANYLRSNQIPPAKVRSDGAIEDPKGPVGFSAALIPYADALKEQQIEGQQMARVQSALRPETGLFGNPARYYDENLVLFGLGFSQKQFWFDPDGKLQLKWNSR
jgi:endoglucanase